MTEFIAAIVATVLVAGGLTILSLEGFAWLHRFRWFRQLRGGHWERHWVRDPVNGFHWLDVDECSRRPDKAEQGRKRPELTSGPFLCEEYGTGFSLIARRAD